MGGYWRGTCSGPMLWDVLGAHVVRCVRGPCCGTCSGPMLWDVFGAHVVGRVWGPCCGTCSGPMLWDVFGTHVVGRVGGPCCGTCSRHTLQDVCGVHVVGHVQGPCSGTRSGPMLCCMATTSKWGLMLWEGGRQRFKFYALVITHLALPHLGPEHIPLSRVARSCGHALHTSPRS